MDFLIIVNSKKYIFKVSAVYKSGQEVFFVKLSVVVDNIIFKQ